MRDNFVRFLDGHIGPVNAIRFTSDGAYCMTAGSDKCLRLWNPHKTRVGTDSNSGLCIQTYKDVHGYPILDVVISKDKAKFVSAGEDRAVFVWDVSTNRVISRISAHIHRTNSILLNHDDSVLFTASYDKTVKCWDLRNRASYEPIQILNDFKDSVTSLARTENTIIASSVDGYVRTYDIRQGLMNADHIGDPITSLAVSEDGKSYLATCLGGKIRLIDIATGKLFKEYSGHKHESFKTEAVFESNSQNIICGSEDGSLFHWNLLNGSVAYSSHHAHSKAVLSVAYHPKEEFFISSSYDGVVKCWSKES